MTVAVDAIAERRFARVFPTWLVPSAWLRITLIYLWQHWRWPRLRSPRLFTELVQVRKLHDRDARLPMLSDKVRVKAHVAALLGDAWVIPTVWEGDELPVEPPAPLPLVVKSRHGCGQIAFVRDHKDWQRARERSAGWMRQRYGRWLDEWAYGEIPRGLLIEPLIGCGEQLPVDYKFFVFGGRVEFVQVHLGRGGRHRWVVLDRAWRRVSADDGKPVPPRPQSLAQMVAGAEALSRGFDHVRVDLYELAGAPVFGEMTFYPGSGVLPIRPLALDRRMGRAWLAARADGARAGDGCAIGSTSRAASAKRWGRP